MDDQALIFRPAAKSLDARVVRLWRWHILFWTLGLALTVAVAGWLLEFGARSALAAFAALLPGLLLALLWPSARYRSWSFEVRDADVVLRRGVWWRVTSIVPHSRIQHVDTTHGPLERKLGLSSVVLFTAGTVGASIEIPGLPVGEAAALRDLLASLGRPGEAV